MKPDVKFCGPLRNSFPTLAARIFPRNWLKKRSRARRESAQAMPGKDAAISGPRPPYVRAARRTEIPRVLSAQ